MFVINEWLERYEVNDKGDQAKPGQKLRARPLDFIRSSVHGRSLGAGFAAMQDLAGERAYEVFGLFHKFLEIAGCEPREKRGRLLNARGKPATYEHLAFILCTTVDRIKFAMQVLMDPEVGWIQVVPDDEFRNFPENPEGEKNQNKEECNSENSGNSGNFPEPYITKRNETKPNRTKQNETGQENQESQQNSQVMHKGVKYDLGDFKSASFSLRLVSMLENILNARSKSDRSAIHNIVNWLNLQVMAKRFNEEIFQQVVDIATESKSGRNPMAVFFSSLDEQIGYRARAAKQKGEIS